MATYSGGVATWSSSTSYVTGNQVGYNSQLWQATANNSNSAPTLSNSNWTLLTPANLSAIVIEEVQLDAYQHQQAYVSALTFEEVNVPKPDSLYFTAFTIEQRANEPLLGVKTTYYHI